MKLLSVYAFIAVVLAFAAISFCKTQSYQHRFHKSQENKYFIQEPTVLYIKKSNVRTNQTNIV